MKKPRVSRVYRNHHLDSTRWEEYRPKAGDVVVTTAYKSGTTWTLDIFHELLRGHLDPVPSRMPYDVWPDADMMGISRDELREKLDGLESPRVLKSHLPLDGLPWFPEVRYVIVCRDPRDVFMSFFNHYSRYTDDMYARLNDLSRLEGEPIPRCPEDPRELWRSWISRGWFEWESEGWPFWSNLHHTQTYWEFRELPNLIFLHYSDMLEDLPHAVRQLADFAGIAADDNTVARVAERTTFANVKKRLPPEDEDSMAGGFRGGSHGFFFKGTNGRWRDVLTEADLELYEAAKARVLTPDCARFLEEGAAGAC